jgi:ribose transport system substrate-binding protein
MNARKTLLMLVALSLCLVTGCDGNSTTGNSSSSSTIRLAVIPKGTTHVFWKSVEAGARKAGDEEKIDIIWKGPLTENDAAQQIGLVEQFAAEGVSGIVLAPLDANALRRPVQEAAKRMVPVVIYDSGLAGEPGKDFVSFVATDNRKGGTLAGEELVRLLGGKGKAVLLRYNAGSNSTDERENGFLEVMAKNPDIQVIEKDRYGGATVGDAQKTAENLLDKLRETNGIFCPNESSTLGMLNALKANGLAGQKKFVGFDATPALVSALRAGEVQALVAQNPTHMGYTAVKTMVSHLRGNKVEPNIDTGCELVTTQNVETPKIKAMIGQ